MKPNCDVRHPMQSVALITVCMACAVLLSTASQADADWPMFRGDPQHSGLASLQDATQLQIAWSAELGGSVDSSPAVADGVVYVGNSSGEVVALDAGDGERLWSFHTDRAVVSSPAVTDDLVIVGSVDRFLYALDAASGEQVWSYRTRGPVISSPVIVSNTVVFGSMDGRLYAVSVEDGSLLWQTEAGPGIQGAAAVTGNLVLYGDDAGTMRAVRLSDGAVVWEREGGGGIVAAPVIRDGVAVFGLMGPSALRPPKLDYLVAVNAETGEQLWALHEAYSVLSSPVIGEERVFFVTVEGYVSKTVARAARLSDGELVWERRVAGVVDSSPALLSSIEGTQKRLCFGCHDGRVYLLNAASGAISDVRPLDSKIYSSPAVSNGSIYIGANDGHLYCLR